MRLRFFTVPCIGGEQIEAELNRFLASKKVLTVDRQVVDYNGTPCWACCVSYLPTSEGFPTETKENKKVDYKTVLSPEAFEFFSHLRAARKQLAANDAVPETYGTRAIIWRNLGRSSNSMNSIDKLPSPMALVYV